MNAQPTYTDPIWSVLKLTEAWCRTHLLYIRHHDGSSWQQPSLSQLVTRGFYLKAERRALQVASRALSIADQRLGIKRVKSDASHTSVHYGLIDWRSQAGAVSASARQDIGR